MPHAIKRSRLGDTARSLFLLLLVIASYTLIVLAAVVAKGEDPPESNGYVVYVDPGIISYSVDGYSPGEIAAAEPVTITGPATADLGDVVRIKLEGTPTIDRGKTLEDQDAWIIGEDRLIAYVFPPGSDGGYLDLIAPLVIDTEHGVYTYQPMGEFIADRVGTWRVVIDWNYGQNQLVRYRVEIDGDDPGPVDPPAPVPDPIDPPPAPEPSGGPWQLMIFHESEDLVAMTPDQIELCSGLLFRKEVEALGHDFQGSFDRSAVVTKKTQRCTDGVCRIVDVAATPQLAAWWATVKNAPLPCLALAPLDGGTIQVFPLPANKADAFELLETTR